MDDDDTGAEGRRLPNNWPDFPGLKKAIDDAWPNRPPPSSSGIYEVIIQVQGNNPISGYRVTFVPSE